MRLTFVTVFFASLAATAFAQDKPKDLTELLNDQKNLTDFTTLLTKQYADVYANLSYQTEVTILAPSNEAFAKIPYSSLHSAFENNRSDVIRAVLQYHILPGIHRADSYNGSFSFTPSWLSNNNYTNVTGGQVVGGVQQAGNVNVFTSGLGSRSTLTQAVSLGSSSVMSRAEIDIITRISTSMAASSTWLIRSSCLLQISSVQPLNSILLLLVAL